MIPTVLQVALGGAVGAVARYGLGVAMIRAFGPGFPWATMTVNILGSFAMGALVVFLLSRGLTQYSPLVLTGLLGGFTTFSAFSLDAVTLWEKGHADAAIFYAAASVFGSVLALMAGLWLMRSVLA